MELKLFTALIDALGKVAGGLKAIVNLVQSGAGGDAAHAGPDLSPDEHRVRMT